MKHMESGWNGTDKTKEKHFSSDIRSGMNKNTQQEASTNRHDAGNGGRWECQGK